MCENFIIAKRYKLRDFVSFHFVFAVNYVGDKNVLYGIMVRCALLKANFWAVKCMQLSRCQWESLTLYNYVLGDFTFIVTAEIFTANENMTKIICVNLLYI